MKVEPVPPAEQKTVSEEPSGGKLEDGTHEELEQITRFIRSMSGPGKDLETVCKMLAKWRVPSPKGAGWTVEALSDILAQTGEAGDK